MGSGPGADMTTFDVGGDLVTTEIFLSLIDVLDQGCIEDGSMLPWLNTRSTFDSQGLYTGTTTPLGWPRLLCRLASRARIRTPNRRCPDLTPPPGIWPFVL